MACSPKARCYSAYGTGISFMIIGIFMICFWPMIYRNIVQTQLSLSEDSRTYSMWKETPIPMYLDIYLFNWTNVEEVEQNWETKPVLEELGPYVFSEKHVRVNMTWNENKTISFEQIRTWHFEPSMSKGGLDDKITHLNVVAATVGFMVRHKHYLIQRAIDYIMFEKKEVLSTTKTVSELLFDGYDDKLMDLVKDLNITGFNIPFTRFGWFVGRNNSATYDGLFNMYTGVDDLSKTGIVTRWNGYQHTPYYPGTCGDITGTTGELWPPVEGQDTVSLFSSDLCSSVPLNHTNYSDVLGISGKVYAGEDNAFDNGERYPENKCYNVGEGMLTGVRNVSQCRFGAPAFISYPHFYLADERYQERIEGIHPNKSIHELYMIIEPKTGIPLTVRARVQINILLQPIPGINMYKNVKKTLFPMFWFVQRAQLTDTYASQVKLLLNLKSIGVYTGCGLVGIGILIVLIALFLTFQKRWKSNEGWSLRS